MNYDAIERAVADGKLWRAKEILQGRLTSPEFDLEPMRRLGEVLLSMGDLIEAGRMLFCAGAREPRHQEAIRAFLARNGHQSSIQFLRKMPLMIRKQDHLANFLRSSAFIKDGWTDDALNSIVPLKTGIKRTVAEPSRWSKLKQRLAMLIGLVFAVFLLVCMIVGFVTIVSQPSPPPRLAPSTCPC